MIDFLLSAGMVPFSTSLLFLVGLVVLELVTLVMGGSILGMGGDGVEIDAPDADFDFDFGAEADLADLGSAEATSGTGGAGGPLSWLGIGDAPFMLWLAGVAASFGLTGYALQLVSRGVFGDVMPAGMAVALALLPGLFGGKVFARLIAAVAPKTETSAVSRSHLGGRRGVISQGTAMKGRPAECRVTDRTGATQYIRVEPQDDSLTIPEGTDVIVLRPRAGIYPVIPFGID